MGIGAILGWVGLGVGGSLLAYIKGKYDAISGEPKVIAVGQTAAPSGFQLLTYAVLGVVAIGLLRELSKDVKLFWGK